ncbi:MAG: nucleotide sugar dehydrogenase [candidate division Zixibacteria bacterium]|nr:nucleotide sugar dehydrogenase [candidate division Zixibacteria bacterium]
MNICVVGTGYVGLVAGTGLADFGMNVTCVDNDPEKIEILNNGGVPIYEIGLAELIQRNVRQNRLHFTTDLASAVEKSLVIYVAVGTPSRPDGSVNLEYFDKVGVEIGKAMKDYKVIAIKSTVPVGSAKRLRQIVEENQSEPVEFDIVSNPEFLREGAAVQDFTHPDRVILGSDSKRALAIMKDIYRPLYLLETPIITTNNETAEMIKYASNTMLALRISFINEIANLCDEVGADVYDVARAVGMDKRIGPKFLHPGPGFGGSCLPKDVKALNALANENSYEFKLTRAVIDANERQKNLIVEKAEKFFGTLAGKKVALLGMAFKQNTDDIREAPSLSVIRDLKRAGAVINVFDPIALDSAKREVDGVNFCEDAFSACRDAHLAIVITEWNEFRNLNLSKLKNVMAQANIFDTRDIYNPERLREMGFSYLTIGRGSYRHIAPSFNDITFALPERIKRRINFEVTDISNHVGANN